MYDGPIPIRQLRGLQLVVVAAFGTLVATLAPVPAAHAAPAQSASGESLEEIVVTAQRREQKLQDVGISVTALSGDELTNLGVTKANDLARYVPGLKTNAFSAAATVYNIRGVSQNDYGDQQEPPVAVYQDESYESSIILAGFPTFDLARVEVLRGPQGTLFGRNATGGALQFVSNQPTDYLDGYAHVLYGSFDRVHVEGAVSGPLGPDFSARIAGEISEGGNFLKAVVPGQHDLGGQQNKAVRGILKWKVSEDTSARLTLRYLTAPHEYDAAAVTHEVACPNEHFQGVYQPGNQGCAFWGTTNGGIATGYRNDAINPQRGGDPWNTAHSYPDYVSRNIFGAQLHFDTKVGNADLVSITDYQHAHKFYSEDTDGTPDAAANYWAGAHLDQYSEELRASAKNGDNYWVLGAMGMVIDGKYDASFALPFFTYYPDVNFNLKTTTYAVFGQDEFQLSPKVKLIGGLRYWHDDKKGFYHGVEASSGVDMTFASSGLVYLQNGVPQALTGVTTTAADANKGFSGVTARAEVDYKPIDTVLLYLSYNRGSKSGGYTFSAGTPFPNGVTDYFNGILYRPETLHSFEAGLKSTLSSKTTLNLSAFLYDYKDYQGFEQVGVVQAIKNLDARASGLEVELASRPAQGLLLQANASVLSSEVKHVLLPDGVTYVNHDLPQSPHFSGAAMARYQAPYGWYGQADFQYSSHFCFSVLCAPVEEENSYSVINARLGYEHNGFDVYVYGENLADNRHRTFTGDNSTVAGFVYSIYAPPRTYGVGVTYQFGGNR